MAIAILGSLLYGTSLGMVLPRWRPGRAAVWLALSAGTGWTVFGPALVLATRRSPAVCAHACLVTMVYGEAVLIAGAALTDLRFHTSRIEIDDRGENTHIQVHSPEAPARVELSSSLAPVLQAGSAFGSLEQAAEFLKYKPFGISIDERRGEANVVQIVREERLWQSRLVHVINADWRFFADEEVGLEICYQVEPIEYQWNRGRLHSLR